jgi:hypothetical protein
LELLFAKQLRTNQSKNASSLGHHASKERIQPTMATLSLAQRNNQQSRGTNLSSKIIGNNLNNFIPVDCCLVASFSNLVKKDPTMAMLTMAIAILRQK